MLIARKAVICSRCLVTEPWVRSFIFARVLQLCYNAFMSVQVYGCNHLAIEVDEVKPDRIRHFGLIVRDEQQLNEVRKKVKEKYGLKLEPPFRCDFRDPWGNRIQVVDLHDESLIWLLPYAEVQKVGIKF